MRDWKEFLLDGGRLATATVAGTIEKTKAVFNWAKDQKWITESPLKGVGAGSYRNEDNDRFVTQEEYYLLLDACQCQEWRTIIALARMGGLRPCEIMVLRWSDIDRENDWFVVHSPKTKDRKREGRNLGRLVSFFVIIFEKFLQFFLHEAVGFHHCLLVCQSL